MRGFPCKTRLKIVGPNSPLELFVGGSCAAVSAFVAAIHVLILCLLLVLFVVLVVILLVCPFVLVASLGCVDFVFASLCLFGLRYPQNAIFLQLHRILPLFSAKAPVFKILLLFSLFLLLVLLGSLFLILFVVVGLLLVFVLLLLFLLLLLLLVLLLLLLVIFLLLFFFFCFFFFCLLLLLLFLSPFLLSAGVAASFLPLPDELTGLRFARDGFLFKAA